MGDEIHSGKGDWIILIGYRCTGKTSVGRRLAERLNLPFVDTDRLMEEAAGMTIAEMVAIQGWEFFRQREREAINSLTTMGKTVIATGGGTVMDVENAAFLKQKGTLIWLKADARTIRQRMLADPATDNQRPRFSSQELAVEISNILAIRSPVYQRLADFTIDTSVMNLEGCVAVILNLCLAMNNTSHWPKAITRYT